MGDSARIATARASTPKPSKTNNSAGASFAKSLERSTEEELRSGEPPQNGTTIPNEITSISHLRQAIVGLLKSALGDTAHGIGQSVIKLNSFMQKEKAKDAEHPSTLRTLARKAGVLDTEFDLFTKISGTILHTLDEMISAHTEEQRKNLTYTHVDGGFTETTAEINGFVPQSQHEHDATTEQPSSKSAYASYASYR